MPGTDIPNSVDVADQPSSAQIGQPADRIRPRRGCQELDCYLKSVVALHGSDLHLKAGSPARIRVDGALRVVQEEPLPSEQFEEEVFRILSEDQREQLLREGAVDLAYDLDGSDRFRINVYRQQVGISVAARRVVRAIPSVQELHLPAVITKIAENRQGLVLVAGITGSGKSTTIAAMLEHINRTRSAHIVTIEDPIEYLYEDKKCLINQREIGVNVRDFASALRSLMREDPDIVLVGEMRDAETFQAALQAAETGHLVFGTVHASSSAQTVSRVLDLFPEDARRLVRQSFVFNLKAIVCQKLLPSITPGVSRVPAVEVMVATPSIQKLIAEERDSELIEVIRGSDEGMQSFTDSLQYLVEHEFIAVDAAHQAAPNPEELKMRLKGIVSTRGGILG